MNLFYSENIEKGKATLTEDEYIHCCKVLRKKIGDEIYITNGEGNQSKAIIDQILKKEAHLKIIETTMHPEANYKNIIAIAPPKNRSRWEWFVEKSIEIGIDHIIPLRTKNSERIKINIERSKKIMRSAALQSLRYYHPQISELSTLDELYKMQLSKAKKQKIYLAHYNPAHSHLKDVIDNQQDKIILIGPEGDFADSELEEAKEKDVEFVNLSANRLRTETAGIIASSIII